MGATTTETQIIQAKYQYTEDEKQKLGGSLAEKHIRMAELTEQKKLSASRFKEQIDTLKNDINGVSINLSNGYEYRDYKCVVEYDYKKAVKHFRHVGTAKIVDTRPFDPEDYQRKLPLDQINKKGRKKVEKIIQDATPGKRGRKKKQEPARVDGDAPKTGKDAAYKD